MSVYLTGDCHGKYMKIYSCILNDTLKDNDTIIVLGDMGLFWEKDKKRAKDFIEKWENNYKINLYFVDGNHENFKILNSLEEDENGMGNISEHIKHLKRGHHYKIEGKDFLTIGGADSIDKAYRIENLSWWKEERISDKDIENIENIKYDFVLSHCCPRSIFDNNKKRLCTLGNIINSSDEEFHISENKLEEVLQKIDFDKWYFGHYHINKKLDDKFECLYEYIIKII